MNHPRRVRLRRLLLLVPLMLLGAALLVRTRLSRPQTEGDKWLWEQAENVTALSVVSDFSKVDKSLKVGLSGIQTINVEDRQGTRALLRAFQDTPAFTPTDRNRYWCNTWRISVFLSQNHNNVTLSLYKKKGCYFLANRQGEAMTTLTSVKRFLKVMQEANDKGRRQQSGYTSSAARYGLER